MYSLDALGKHRRKDCGCMGLGNLHDFDLALIRKTSFEEDSLGGRSLKHFSNGSFLYTDLGNGGVFWKPKVK